jgi:hypothetical protein
MLEGRGFVVFTDHKPLVGALRRRSDPVSARQQRHLSFIAEFAPTIRHITGDSNIVADTLSRPATACSGSGEAAKRQAEVLGPSRRRRAADSQPAHWSGGSAVKQNHHRR